MLFQLPLLLDALILQPLHVPSVEADRVGSVHIVACSRLARLLKLGNKRFVRLYIAQQFIRQDVLAKPFPHESATDFLQCHQLVGTIYLEFHLHAVIHIDRNDLMHVEVFTDHVGTLTIILFRCFRHNRHPFTGEDVLKRLAVYPVIVTRFCNIDGRNEFGWQIHLLHQLYINK